MGLQILSYGRASSLQMDIEAYNPLFQRTFISCCGFRIAYPVEVKGLLGKLVNLISNTVLSLLNQASATFFDKTLLRPEREYILIDLKELNDLVRKEEAFITKDSSPQKIGFYQAITQINDHIFSKFNETEIADLLHLLNNTVSKTRAQELIETQESMLNKLDIRLGYSVACQELKTLYHKILSSSFSPQEKRTLKVAIFQKFAVNLSALIREDDPYISDEDLILRLKNEHALSHGIDPLDASLLQAEILKIIY